MMTITITPTTQPATTPATLEEESSLSVCVLPSDCITVVVADVDEELATLLVDDSVVDIVRGLAVLMYTVVVGVTFEELAVLVDDSVVDIVRELVILLATVAVRDTFEELAVLADDPTTIIVGIDREPVVAGSTVAVAVIYEKVLVLVDNSTIVMVDIDRATEELAVLTLADNSIIPVLEDKAAVVGETDPVGTISIMQNKNHNYNNLAHTCKYVQYFSGRTYH